MMEKSTKAALFSALVFPGAGLWWLKEYWRAAIFIIPAAAAIWYICVSLHYVMDILAKRVNDGSLHIDILNLDQTVKQVTTAMQSIIETQHYHLDAAQWIFIASWICSTVSSYFVGKKFELNETQSKPQK